MRKLTRRSYLTPKEDSKVKIWKKDIPEKEPSFIDKS